MDLSCHFGAALRHHRALLNLSQEDLATKAGLDRTYVSGVERGARNPTLRVMQRLADAVESDLAALFETAKQFAATREQVSVS